MTRYLRKLHKPVALDTIAVRAAVNLVLAVRARKPPDQQTLQILHDAFLEIFGGKPPAALFGSSCGFTLPKGKPPEHGFTPSDVVSAFIELERRKFEQAGEKAALTRAQESAARSFVCIDGQQDPMRAVRRDWRKGRKTAQALDDKGLWVILEPYRIPDK